MPWPASPSACWASSCRSSPPPCSSSRPPNGSWAAHRWQSWSRAPSTLDISITDETNTKAEKALYLREVHAAFEALLPRLHPVSYVHLIDARAAAYGYGGRTQEWRHQQAGVQAVPGEWIQGG